MVFTVHTGGAVVDYVRSTTRVGCRCPASTTITTISSTDRTVSPDRPLLATALHPDPVSGRDDRVAASKPNNVFDAS
jgi:hypothetical protein